MKLQLDSEKKTLKIEGNVKMSELVKHLEALLPKDCKLGHWKDYELECNTIINNWSYPIVVKDYFYPWYQQPYITYTTSTNTGFNEIETTNCVYNLELN